MVLQADTSTDQFLNRPPAVDRAAVGELSPRHPRAAHGDLPVAEQSYRTAIALFEELVVGPPRRLMAPRPSTRAWTVLPPLVTYRTQQLLGKPSPFGHAPQISSSSFFKQECCDVNSPFLTSFQSDVPSS
jgi:hypothetical protein